MPSVAVEYLMKSIDSNVLVSLRANYWLRGILKTFDQHLNIIIDNVEEISTPKSPNEEQEVVRLGKRVFVRGDNIVAISGQMMK